MVTIRSDAQATPNPPARVKPSVTETMICGAWLITLNRLPKTILISSARSFASDPAPDILFIPFKSPPAQNMPPLPRRVIPRTSLLLWTQLNTLKRSAIRLSVNAFRFSIRLNQISNQPSVYSSIKFSVLGRFIFTP